MNFLAIDTGGTHLTVIVNCNGKKAVRYTNDCAHLHSVRLMDEINSAFEEAGATPNDCDFFAVVVGPGSFTGIRIGIATIKGLCFACEKKALALTSFSVAAYSVKSEKPLALVNAGHGAYYAHWENNSAYITAEEAQALIKEGYEAISFEPLPLPTKVGNPAQGLEEAVKAGAGALVRAEQIQAEYLRKSSAEEGR